MNRRRERCQYCDRMIVVGAPMDSHVHSKHWLQVRERLRFALLLWWPEMYFDIAPKQLTYPKERWLEHVALRVNEMTGVPVTVIRRSETLGANANAGTT